MMQLDDIRRQIPRIGDIEEFLRSCSEGGETPAGRWIHAKLPLEAAFDAFMQQLAEVDRRIAILFAARFARYAWTLVRDNHLDEAREMGFAFLASDPCFDGEPIEKQLMNVEGWLVDPTEENRQVVRNGIDPSRQMEIWDEDLLPPGDQMWLWILGNTHLLSLAVVAGDSGEDDDSAQSPYGWSSRACIARSALCSLKSIAAKDRDVRGDLAGMFRSIGDGW